MWLLKKKNFARLYVNLSDTTLSGATEIRSLAQDLLFYKQTLHGV